MFFSVYTLGCKLNQLETEAITDAFCREGFNFDTDSVEPAIVVINTCTVTSMAEQKARRIIRKLLREHPQACLIVTGCYAQMEKAALEALPCNAALEPPPPGSPRRLFVVPGEKKDRILDLPRFLARTAPSLPVLIASWLDTLGQDSSDGAFRFRPEAFSSHSRAFLKIQDGCGRCCSFCRVSIARGKSRSLGAEEVLKELRTLEQRGFAEVVLTGVNITQFQDSVLKTPGLPGLLDFLLKGTEKTRLRLSSIEPEDGGFTDELIQVLANPRIRPHFHLSIQSGSAEILAKMGRHYAPEDIENAVKRLCSVREDPFLACDIIAGFPGETEEEFEKTYILCERIGFSWIHAFPFSRRPGTAAYHFSGKVSEREAVKRVERLTELGRKGRREYICRWEGKKVEAVIEAGKGEPKGSAAGLSENYLKLLVACRDEPIPAPGSLVKCRILQTSFEPFDALAEMC